MTPERVLSCAFANRTNVRLLERLSSLMLPQCYIAAGCLFQAVWNLRSQRPASEGVRDYDVAYFDGDDLSFDAEDDVIRRVQAVTADLGVQVEVRNQARVHLWYEKRFGCPYPPLRSAQEGIDRYLVDCTCIGVEVNNGTLYASGSLTDLEAGLLRPNPRYRAPSLFQHKAEAYRCPLVMAHRRGVISPTLRAAEQRAAKCIAGLEVYSFTAPVIDDT